MAAFRDPVQTLAPCYSTTRRGEVREGPIDTVLKSRLFSTSEQFVSVCFGKMETRSECPMNSRFAMLLGSRAAYMSRIGSIATFGKGGII